MSEQRLPLIPQKITYKSKAKISLIILNTVLSSFYFGYCLAFLGQISTDTLISTFSIPLSKSTAEGILNGCVPVGALFGALLSSILISRFSRRKCLLMTNFFAFSIGGLIYIQHFPMLVFCRIGQGLCVGLFNALVPLIIKQLSPTELYGALGSYSQLSITTGIFISCILSYSLSKVMSDEYSWYILFGVPQITVIIQTFILIFIFPYETPKYLLSIGKKEEARKLISTIYKPQFVDQILQQKLKDLQLSKIEKNEAQSLISNVKDPSSLPNSTIAIIIAIHLSILQQFSGITTVTIYGGNKAQEAVSGQLKLLIPSLFNFQQILAIFFNSFFLNKFGRRTILVFGALFTGLSCGIVMIGFFLQSQSPIREPIIVAGLFIFGAVFGLTLGPVIWLYIPEIVQPKIVSISTATSCIRAAIVVILFPIITQDLLNGNPTFLFVFFTAWCLLSSVFNFKYVLETKDKTEKTIRQEYLNLMAC